MPVSLGVGPALFDFYPGDVAMRDGWARRRMPAAALCVLFAFLGIVQLSASHSHAQDGDAHTDVVCTICVGPALAKGPPSVDESVQPRVALLPNGGADLPQTGPERCPTSRPRAPPQSA